MRKFKNNDFDNALLRNNRIYSRNTVVDKIHYSVFLSAMNALSGYVESDDIENTFFRLIVTDTKELTQRIKEVFVEDHSVGVFLINLYDLKMEDMIH